MIFILKMNILVFDIYLVTTNMFELLRLYLRICYSREMDSIGGLDLLRQECNTVNFECCFSTD